nr:glycosyltransferase family 4 protein [Galbitalea soli]
MSNLYPPRVRGGYELAAFHIVQELERRGHEVDVLTGATEQTIPTGDARVHRLLDVAAYPDVPPPGPVIERMIVHRSRVSNLTNSLLLLAALRRIRPDHVLAFNVLGLGGLAMLDTLNRAGVPWTLSLGDKIPTMLADLTTAPIIELFGAKGPLYAAGQIAPISQTVADEAAAEGIDLGPSVRIIPRGVPQREVRRTRRWPHAGPVRFVAAGTINEQKGSGIVVAAARLLRERGCDDFRVDVYGGGEVEAFEARAAAEGVADRVTFHGAVPQERVIVENADADAFLFPTWEREPLGNAPLEAASVGCVPILTASCGAAELLVDGVHAIKVPRTAEHFAEAMQRVCEGEVDLARLSAAGIRLAAGPLSLAHSVDTLEEFMLAGGRPGWEAAALDSAQLGAAVVANDREATRLLYDDCETRDGIR